MTARRLNDRDNPVPLLFAPILPNGPTSTDINRDAIAYISGGPSDFAFVGIDYVRFNGNNTTVDSMQYGQNGTGGGVGSDGNIELGNGNVYGDARPGIGDNVNFGPNGTVTGWTNPLDYALKDRYPPVTLADAAGATPVTTYQKNKPLSLSGSGNASSPTRYLLNESLDHPDPLTVSGYVTLYVNGDVNLQGSLIAGTPGQPAKLEIRVIGPGRKVDLGGNSIQFLHLYAPDSDVRVHGTDGFTGTIVGKSLTIDGNSKLHYDESNHDSNRFKVTLVK